MEKKKVLFTLFCVLESGAMGFLSNHLTKWCGSVFFCLDAATISECAKNMNNILNNFNDRMKELKAKEVIVGRAADALEENFLNLRNNFDS